MINCVKQGKTQASPGFNLQAKPGGFQQQRGAALITSLIFLILLTLLGFSSSRSVIMQELISRNYSDQNLAFQAAEAALKYAEACIRVSDGLPSGGIASVSASCASGNAIPPPYADDWVRTASATFWADAGTQLDGGTLTLPSGALSSQPIYVIALMNRRSCITLTGRCIYQITASGTGISPNSQKIIQSIYRF